MRSVIVLFVLFVATADAARLGPERPVLPDERRARATASPLDVAADGAGAYAVAHARSEDRQVFASGYDGSVILGQRLEADGTPRRETQTVLASANDADVAFGGARYFVATSSAAPLELHAIDRAGALLRSIRIVEDAAAADVAADGERVFVVWVANGVWFAVYDHELRTIVPPKLVAAASRSPVSAAAAGGNFAFAWTDADSTNATLVGRDGDTATFEIGPVSTFVDLAGGGGEFLLLHSLPTATLAVQALSPTLARLGPAWTVPTERYVGSQRVSYADGAFAISWHRHDGIGSCPQPTLHVARATSAGLEGPPLVKPLPHASHVRVQPVVATARGPLLLWHEQDCRTTQLATRAGLLPLGSEPTVDVWERLGAQRPARIAGDTQALVGMWVPDTPRIERADLFRLALPELTPLASSNLADEAVDVAVASGGGRHLVAWSSHTARVRVLDGNGAIVGGDELSGEVIERLDAAWLGDRFLVIGDDTAAYVSPNGTLTKFSLAGQLDPAHEGVRITPGGPAPLLTWGEEPDGRADRTRPFAAQLLGTTVSPPLALTESRVAQATFTGGSYLLLQQRFGRGGGRFLLSRIDATATAILHPPVALADRHPGGLQTELVFVEGTSLAIYTAPREIAVVDLERSLACACLAVVERHDVDGLIQNVHVEQIAPQLFAVAYRRHGRVDATRGVAQRAFVRLLSTAPARRRSTG